MKNKKKQYRSIPVKQRLELLKNHYDYDEEKRLFNISLHYERVSDIFDARLNLTKLPVVNDEVMDSISDLLDYIPKGYKATFSLVIDDYEGYDADAVLSSFNEQLRIRYNLFEAERKRHSTKIGILMVFGLFFIVVTIVGEVDGWWVETDVSLRLINYFLDTLGCVLIWEGIYAALLEPSDLLTFGNRLSTRMGGLSLFEKTLDKPLTSESNDVIAPLIKRDLRKRFASICLLISAFGFFLVGLTQIVVGISLLFNAIRDGETNLLPYLLTPIGELPIDVVLGLLTFRLFYEDFRFIVLNWIMNFVFLLAVGLEIYQMVNGLISSGEIVSNVMMLIVLVLYFIGFVFAIYFHRKDKREGKI